MVSSDKQQLQAGAFTRFQILVECDDLLGIFVNLVVGNFAPDDLAEEHAPVGVDDGSVWSGASICKPQGEGCNPGRPRDEHLMGFESHADLVASPHPPFDFVLASKFT